MRGDDAYAILKKKMQDMQGEKIQESVNRYFDEHPVQAGATAEQVQQIEQNKKDVNSLKEEKINKPKEGDNNKIARAKNGEVEWAEVGQPTDEQTSEAVTKWLDKHPEATTTIQDGVISEQKISIDFLPYIKNGYITPEMFGAVGDGITDDTYALQRMFIYAKNNECKHIYIPPKTYAITSSDEYISAATSSDRGILKINGIQNATIECKGIIKCITESRWTQPIFSFNHCDGTTVNGLRIDGNEKNVSGIEISYSSCMSLENCVIENIGNTSASETRGIQVQRKSDSVTIKNCTVKKIYSSVGAVGISIWTGYENENSHIPRNILIDGCRISDIYPILNADGISANSEYLKGEQINLIVQNCYFEDCRKRALKFKAEGCHSLNNIMIWNERGVFAIDFQMGYNTSNGDTIISHFQGDTDEGNPNVRGYFRSVIEIDGNYCVVKDLGYFTTTDPSWVLGTSINGRDIKQSFLEFGSQECPFSFVDGEIITNANLNSCNNNIIENIYGNGVVTTLLELSFINNLTDDMNLSKDNLTGQKTFLLQNTFRNIKLRHTGNSIISNVDAYMFGIRTSIFNNRFEEVVLTQVNQPKDQQSYVYISLPSVYESSTNFRHNYADFSFEGGGGRILFMNPHVALLHDNQLLLRGSMESTQNIYPYNPNQIVYNENLQVVFPLDVDKANIVDNPVNAPAWKIQCLKKAIIGDICMPYYTLGIDDDGRVILGWICTEEPSESHEYGVWEKFYSNNVIIKNYDMNFDEKTKTLNITT